MRSWHADATTTESAGAVSAVSADIRRTRHGGGGGPLSSNRSWLSSRKGAIASAIALAAAMAGSLWLLAALELLDSSNAADWVTAVFTGGLVVVAGAAFWPAASQVRQAAKASAESHRPYVTVVTRAGIGGFVYLDLVNNGNRAARNVTAALSSPPLENVKNAENPKAPFGRVSYLAPNERRSVFYSSGKTDKWPPELVVEISYTGEDEESHSATVTHNLGALKLILANPENKRTPQTLITEGLNRFERIVNRAVQQVAENSAPLRRRRHHDRLKRLGKMRRST